MSRRSVIRYRRTIWSWLPGILRGAPLKKGIERSYRHGVSLRRRQTLEWRRRGRVARIDQRRRLPRRLRRRDFIAAARRLGVRGLRSLLPQDFVAGAPTAPALDEALALFNEARASKLAAAPPPVPSAAPPAVPSGDDEPAAKRARASPTILMPTRSRNLPCRNCARRRPRAARRVGPPSALQARLLGALVG